MNVVEICRFFINGFFITNMMNNSVEELGRQQVHADDRGRRHYTLACRLLRDQCLLHFVEGREGVLGSRANSI